ncbi:MAG: hypothetical protein ACHQF0_08520 [Chitinophagales bacterium]
MLKLFFIILFSFIILVVINQYFFCPVFSFNTTRSFSGKSFYNPYDSIDPGHWVKCNFHAHTNAWHGLTHGSGTAKDVYHMYDSMHYGVHCVSDYQTINKTYANTPGYISAYEHGYNFGKTHQLVLGSNEVQWIDYQFPQSLDNKQHVLNRLMDSDDVVIVNHPLAFHGYHASDFRYLTNYHCMEVLSPYAISTAGWDTALSNGKPVFIVGNDDEHDIFNKDCLAKMCTWINVASTDQKTVLNALKKGKGYGMIIGDRNDDLPVLNYLKLSGDTIVLQMNEAASQISFTGQNGKLLAVHRDTSSASYIIRPGDHYIRAVIDYPKGTSIFLNPVFRYDKTNIPMTSFHINAIETNVKRLLGLFIFIIWIAIIFRFAFSKRFYNKSRAGSVVLQ